MKPGVDASLDIVKKEHTKDHVEHEEKVKDDIKSTSNNEIEHVSDFNPTDVLFGRGGHG